MKKPASPETSFQVLRPQAGAPLLHVLADRLHVSRKRAKILLDERRVTVNHRRIWMARHPLQAGDEVRVQLPPAPRARPADLPILYRDDDLVVFDKPPGLLTNAATDSLEARARTQLNAPQLRVVHRLDRDTTGCLLALLDPSLYDTVVDSFRQDRVTKVYHAILLGRLDRASGQIRRRLGEENALTRYQVLAAAPLATHIRVQLVTGRTHQIRKHVAALRHPVAGDRQYGPTKITDPLLRTLPRPMLHAQGLRLPHPRTGQELNVRAPLPADFRKALKKLHLTPAPGRR